MTDPLPIPAAAELVEEPHVVITSLGQLFDVLYPPIFAYCVRRLTVRAVAEDVTSEVFLKVAGGWDRFPGTSVEDFRRWVFRIATNEINAHLRQSIRRQELLEAAVHLGAIDASVTRAVLDDPQSVTWENLYEALDALSQREQSLVSLRFFADMKHDEIAGVLQMKTGSVRVALSRALGKLRDHLRRLAVDTSAANLGFQPSAIEKPNSQPEGGD